jgi:hypothetical protein
MATDSSVVTFSFGGERVLRLKHNKTNDQEDIHLKAGSLFVLGWKTNSIWKHSIVKTKRPCERRVSLTYRLIKTIKHNDGTLTETDGSGLLVEETDDNSQSNVIENNTKKMKTNNESN